MGQELQVPDSFKGKAPSQGFSFLDPTSESLAEGIGQSYGVIGYKGKVWSLQYKGENNIFTREVMMGPTTNPDDDKTTSNYIDLIVLRDPGHKARSYYEVYEEGAVGIRPICASMDNQYPDADVQEKQSDVCGICPRSRWKTDVNGRRKVECSEYKRLAVLLMPEQSARLLGEPLVEPVFLRIPPDSLAELEKFGRQKTKEGFHYSTFVMRISFDPKAPHPKFLYKGIAILGNEEAGLILELREDSLAKRITGEEVITSSVTLERLAPQSIGLVQAMKPTVRFEPRKGLSEEGEAVISNPPPKTNPPAGDAIDIPAEDKSLDDRIAELMKV